MLTDLYIRNYILINEIHLSFSDGLTVITGETGAGKSVIIGAVAQLLGERFDQKMLFDATQKCIIEGTFQIDSQDIKKIFVENDIDYQPQTIIRREIAVGGRSRTFINDTPVNGTLLKEIGRNLVDIHSQHETLELQSNLFQLNVIDRFGKLQQEVEQLSEHFQYIHQLKKEFSEKKSALEQILREQDYRNFVLNELEAAHPKPNEINTLEQSFQILSQADHLLQWTEKIQFLLASKEEPVITNLELLVAEAKKFNVDDERITSIYKRLHSISLELKEIARDAENFSGSFESNPEQLEEIGIRLDMLNNLIFKYHVSGCEGLIELQNQYQQQLESSENLQEELNQLQKNILSEEEKWNSDALKISEKRSKLYPKIEQQLTQLLKELGIPEAKIEVKSQHVLPTETGIDQISLMFSANSGMNPEEIRKVASGGELSRIMLAIKYLVSDAIPLSTFIFDEIDTGISGTVATKVGAMLKKMAENKQIFSITHLPTIAASGAQHLFVYKQTHLEKTSISARYLTYVERITEIAQIISGEKFTNSALETAKQLLHQ